MGREFQGRMRLKKKKKNPGWVHFTAYGGHVCHVTAREHCGYTGVQADRNHCLAIKRKLFHTHTQTHTKCAKKTASPCKVLSARFTVHLHFSRWMRVCVCVMWFIPLVIALVAQARCQRLVVADLFTFVGWQEHEISSGCTAAGRPANSMALQVFCCSRYRLPRPRPPPSCGSLVLRVTPRKHKLIRILTRAHWSHENQPSCRVNAGKHEPAQTHLDILQLLHLRD